MIRQLTIALVFLSGCGNSSPADQAALPAEREKAETWGQLAALICGQRLLLGDSVGAVQANETRLPGGSWRFAFAGAAGAAFALQVARQAGALPIVSVRGPMALDRETGEPLFNSTGRFVTQNRHNAIAATDPLHPQRRGRGIPYTDTIHGTFPQSGTYLISVGPSDIDFTRPREPLAYQLELSCPVIPYRVALACDAEIAMAFDRFQLTHEILFSVTASRETALWLDYGAQLPPKLSLCRVTDEGNDCTQPTLIADGKQFRIDFGRKSLDAGNYQLQLAHDGDRFDALQLTSRCSNRSSSSAN
ncbi:MAG: hypothetical protein H6707_12665 [Deltaproteobacteria bacterium]|nr:hypothetical protein [Deltaproteobacteria bacterium]